MNKPKTVEDVLRELEEVDAKYGKCLNDFLRAYNWALRWKATAKRYRRAVKGEPASPDAALLRQRLSNARTRDVRNGIFMAELIGGKRKAQKEAGAARFEIAKLKEENAALRAVNKEEE